MEFSFNVDLGVKHSRSKAVDFLTLAGGVISGKAVENVTTELNQNSKGQLASSIFFEVDQKNLKLTVIANTVYARIQHEGGDILPAKAKALAIPVHRDAKETVIPENKTVRDIFPDLVLIPAGKNNSHPILVQMKSRKKDGYQVFDVMYILVTKVHLTGKFYLKNALLSETPKVLQQMRVN